MAKSIFDVNPFFMDIKKRFDHKNQNAFLIVGDTNTGKTKFALMMYYFISKELLGRKKLSMQDDVFCYELMDLIRVIDKLEKQNVFYDEGGRDLDVGKWNSLFNRSLSQIFQTQRIKELFYYIILPHRRHITQTHLVNFNYYIVVQNNFINNELTRTAECYKIKVNHFSRNSYSLMSEEFANYVSYIFLCKFKIPDYNSPYFHELSEFILEYEKYEKKRKQDIAKAIQDEAIMYEEQKEIKRQKVELSKMKLQMDLSNFTQKRHNLEKYI
jgi:hypothetical protein